MNNWKITGFIATVLIVISVPLGLVKHKIKQKTTIPYEQADFVGADKCAECHTNEHNLWLESHHAMSMAVATDETVLGDFNNAELTEEGQVHKFYKRDDRFFVFTEGPEGEWEEFEVTHTFGYVPLQQYLVPFGKGKYQCLPLAWDTIKKGWFNLSMAIYNEKIHHNDWLHWTNQAQNWNGMCSECHSTNLRKNYFHETDSFNTTYSEINVSCEACHGPGSKHVEWAYLPESGRPENVNTGLVVKTSSISNEQYVDLCARCHSRRSQFTNFDHHFKDIFEYMIPTMITHEYFSDGQILDEDYVYGSFLQSKMFDRDVKCNDCHDVHSGKRYFEGNKLCYQCHAPDYYGTDKHHFHKTEEEVTTPYYIDGRKAEPGEGADCINCHMPGRYYMGNDFRNDHSIRVPRPDLTKAIGTPNACNQCHTDKSTDWAINYTKKWYGEKKRPHYGTVIAAAREQKPEAEEKLIEMINDTLNPTIIRATGIELLSGYYSESSYKTLSKYLDDVHPMLRWSAVKNYSNNNLEQYISDLVPMLTDPYRAIRGQAAYLLSHVPQENLPSKKKKVFDKALNEYREGNEYSADFPAGRLNLGMLYSNLGQNEKAKDAYEKAVEIDTAFVPGLINLALSYNTLRRNTDAEKIYKQLIAQDEDVPGVYYSLGLLLAEENRFEESAKYMEIAGDKDPENARIRYNLGLIYQRLNDLGNAEKQLKMAISTDPESFDYLYALTHFYFTSRNINKAVDKAEELKEKFPGNPNALQLINLIEKAQGTKQQ